MLTNSSLESPKILFTNRAAEVLTSVGLCFNGETMYFDSYGLPPQQKVFESYMGKSYTSNNIQLQSNLTVEVGDE